MKTILIDVDGSVSGVVGKALSWHTNLVPNGVNIFEIPADFDFVKYTYIPNEDGTFNPEGFVLNPEIIEII
jgi:hypothetical protein